MSTWFWNDPLAGKKFDFIFRAVDISLKSGGPMVESKPQMKHFTAVALDFPQNRVGQAHLAHTLTTTLLSLKYFKVFDDQMKRIPKTWGAFNNYVDRFLAFFDHPPTPRKQFIK